MKALLRDHRVRLALLAVAAVGAYFLIRRFLPDIDLQQLVEDVSNTLGHGPI